ncbi:MAG: agmatine deiminase family protein, partial [Phycisphaeraceae bacterium]|nr:agmatine deiminase family protein [Phycisphaeraceae bacterium]
MPAEWQPHAATWLAWPHNHSDWPGKLPAVEWVYGEIVRHLVSGETARIVVQDPDHEARARDILNRVGVLAARVEFFTFPTNRGWVRDYGPLFVCAGNEKAVVDFRFNGWAQYDDWQLDDTVPKQAAEALGLKRLPQEMVLEGGAIDVNGRGTLVTTEQCLLDPEIQTRNPGWSKSQVESALRDTLGAENVLWLGDGIAGDDTHGHVDDVCRFVNPETVVACIEPNREDP